MAVVGNIDYAILALITINFQPQNVALDLSHSSGLRSSDRVPRGRGGGGHRVQHRGMDIGQADAVARVHHPEEGGAEGTRVGRICSAKDHFREEDEAGVAR